jgi:predicted signal transduction protein with EAL and GGDEF domain
MNGAFALRHDCARAVALGNHGRADQAQGRPGEQSIRFLARQDVLTGGNRARLVEKLDRFFAALPGGGTVRCHYIDIDDFRRSTTASATRVAIWCSGRSPTACAARCGQARWWRGSLATRRLRAARGLPHRRALAAAPDDRCQPVAGAVRGISAAVAAALRETGCASHRLELIESALLDNTDAIMAELQALEAMGVAIVMDDFGTGYSSLGYLWRFPFDKIKIDRSFMPGFDGSRQDAETVVKTIIKLAASSTRG